MEEDTRSQQRRTYRRWARSSLLPPWGLGLVWLGTGVVFTLCGRLALAENEPRGWVIVICGLSSLVLGLDLLSVRKISHPEPNGEMVAAGMLSAIGVIVLLFVAQ